MKIVFNTNYTGAAAFIGIDQMIPMLEREGHEVKRNDWDNYQNYDVAFFMSPDSKVREAKLKNPKIVTCIIDPKTVGRFERLRHKSLWKQPIMRELKEADLTLVSSIEHRDHIVKYNKNCFIFYFFPTTLKEKQVHSEKKKITIGYHGNKVHLSSMPEVSWALDKLADKYDIELMAIYNVKKLGKWTKNRPKKCNVIDVQWNPDMALDLKKSDIGISPSIKATIKKSNYVFRFKYSNGPGRIYVFAMLGIPVVADASPSQCQFVQNEVSGFVCCTKEGWYQNLERLINDANLRATQGSKLYDFFENGYSIEQIFQNLMKLVKKLQSEKL